MSRTAPRAASVSAVLAGTRRRLRDAGIEGADGDARILVSQALDFDAAGLILNGGAAVSAERRDMLDALVARRLSGEPVHRILGRRAFHAHDFRLSKATLEPRPDTEILVELCGAPIAARVAEKGSCVFADVGTGTGAIAVSLLAQFPQARAIAIDISAEALSMARENAESAGVAARLTLLRSDYLAALAAPVDLVVANPPYIPSAEIARLSREVREHDPILALDGGPDGLDAYRAIAAQASRLPGFPGDVAVEIGQAQGRDVEAVFGLHGFRLHRASNDLSGIERALWFKRSASTAVERVRGRRQSTAVTPRNP